MKPPVVLGNTTYDPRLFLLYIDGTPVHLTRSEVNLLVLLLPRLNTPVRKPILLDEMYGHRPQPPHPAAINVVMCRLRRKLGKSDLALRAANGEITLSLET